MPRNYTNYHIFITRIVKNVDKNINISVEAKDILNNLIKDLIFKYISNSVELCRYAKKITIDSNTITTLTIMWIDNNSLMLEYAHTVWDKYSKNDIKGIKKGVKSGLCIPPSRIFESFKEYKGVNQKIGEPAYIFLTAIIEYIIKQIITYSFSLVKQDNKITINEEYIYRSLNSTELRYLQPLFYNTIICGYGYLRL
jgi:histone H3/H4